MDFVQYLDKLNDLEKSGIRDYPEFQVFKENCSHCINGIVLETQLIPDRFQRKKVQKKLSLLVSAMEEIFNTIDEMNGLSDEDLDRDLTTDKYKARIQRNVQVCYDVQKFLDKMAKEAV